MSVLLFVLRATEAQAGGRSGRPADSSARWRADKHCCSLRRREAFVRSAASRETERETAASLCGSAFIFSATLSREDLYHYVGSRGDDTASAVSWELG